MLLIGVPILTFIISLILFIKWEGIDDLALNLFAAFMFTLLALLLSGAATLVWVGAAPATATYTEPIYALNDVGGPSGTYFLGYGATDSSLKYYYIVDSEYGRTAQYSDIMNTHFNYIDPNEEPYVKHIGKRMPVWLAPGREWIESKTIFYIPEGAVTTNMNIDLE